MNTRRRRLAKARRRISTVRVRLAGHIKHLERQGLQVITEAEMTEMFRSYRKHVDDEVSKAMGIPASLLSDRHI